MRKLIRDFVRYPLEAVAAVVGYALFAALPTDAASALGGWIGRVLGPRLAIHRRALRHIGLALPETAPARRDEIAAEMWDNLGRVLGEYPHISGIAESAGKGGRVEVVGAENLAPLRSSDTAGILFSGHLANWGERGGGARDLGVQRPGRSLGEPVPQLDLLRSRRPILALHADRDRGGRDAVRSGPSVAGVGTPAGGFSGREGDGWCVEPSRHELAGHGRGRPGVGTARGRRPDCDGRTAARWRGSGLRRRGPRVLLDLASVRPIRGRRRPLGVPRRVPAADAGDTRCRACCSRVHDAVVGVTPGLLPHGGRSPPASRRRSESSRAQPRGEPELFRDGRHRAGCLRTRRLPR